MKVLITGINGFEGSNMALHFRNLGWEVKGLDLSTSPREQELEGIEIVKGDIRNKKLVESLIMDAEAVCHLAGQVSHIISQEDPYIDLDINVNGMLNILEAVKNVNPSCHVLFASSRSVYGFPQYMPIDERHPTNPIDAYGVSKRTSEHYCSLYTYHYGINTTCFRQANLFGPRQQLWTSVFQMISWIFRCVALNEEFTFFGDGSQTRDFLYIDGCVRAYKLAILNPAKVFGQIFNLGGAEYTTWNQVMKVAEEVTGNKYKVKYIPHTQLREKLENPHSWLNYFKYKTATGWFPKTMLKRGFQEMQKYFIEDKNIEKYLETQ